MGRLTNAEFLHLMFANAAPGALPWVTAFKSAPGDASRGEWSGWAVKRAVSAPGPGAGNTYVVVSTFAALEGRYRRRKAQFAALHCVMVDDIGPKVPERAIALPFTVEVETSPGNRQGWYRLDPPVADRGQAERLIERMVEAGLTADGRDPGMKGVTRYGRFPEGSNNKPAIVARLGGPWRHLVTAYRPRLSYRIEEVAEGYELDLAPPARVVALRDCPTAESASMLDWLRALGLYRAPLSEGWHEITCPWVHTHTGRVDTGTAYREPREENNYVGGFKCHHGHCEQRGMRDLFAFIDAVEEQLEKRSARDPA